MSSNIELQNTINSSVVDVLEQMKKISGEDRYHLAMEFCEWIFWEDTDREDQLLVPPLQHDKG
tara:strand:+ start:98 stop:286 length:189 start_codon:yes stop_codon:yes gene_type:complete